MKRNSKITLTKNEHVYLESEHIHWIYYLKEGSVRTYRVHPIRSNSITFQILKKGSFFGFFEVLSSKDNRLTSANVTSKSAIIEKYLVTDFLDKLNQDHKFWMDIFKCTTYCQLELWNRIITFSKSKKYRKIGRILIKMASVINDEEETIEIKDYTHLMLSGYCGCTRPQISSALNYFRNMGVIEYNRDHILINKTLMTKLIES